MPTKSAQLIEITSHDHLDLIDTMSRDQPVFVVKHSTRCGISHAALEEVRDFASSQPEEKIFFLDLLANRSISDAITDRYGKPHHSPQVLVIEQGEAIKHATHYGIDARWMMKARY